MRHSPIIRLVEAIFAYCALWLLVPNARFLPFLARMISEWAALAPSSQAIWFHLAATAVAFTPTVVFMAVQLALVYYFSMLRLDFLRCVLILLACAVATGTLVMIMVAQLQVIHRLHRIPNLREVLFIAGFYPSLLRMPIVLTLIIAAATVGYMVSLRIKDKNLLVPVVGFAAFIDLWTVTLGPVSKMMEKTPELVQAVAAPIPKAGAGIFVPQLLNGPCDFLFAGLVFAVVSRFKLDGPRNYWFVFGTMTLGMLAIAAGAMDYFPALILLAVGVIGANWRQIKLSKQEVVSVIVVATILAATLPLVWSIIGNRGISSGGRPSVHSGRRR